MAFLANFLASKSTSVRAGLFMKRGNEALKIGDGPAAVAAFRVAVAAKTELLTARHLSVAQANEYLAEAHRLAGDEREAALVLAQVVDVMREHPKPRNLELAIAMNNWGVALRDIGKWAEARTVFDEAIQVFDSDLDAARAAGDSTPPGASDRALVAVNLARTELLCVVGDQGDLALAAANRTHVAAAESLLRAAVACFREELGAGPDTGTLPASSGGQGAAMSLELAESLAALADALVTRHRLATEERERNGKTATAAELEEARSALGEATEVLDEAAGIYRLKGSGGSEGAAEEGRSEEEDGAENEHKKLELRREEVAEMSRCLVPKAPS